MFKHIFTLSFFIIFSAHAQLGVYSSNFESKENLLSSINFYPNCGTAEKNTIVDELIRLGFVEKMSSFYRYKNEQKPNIAAFVNDKEKVICKQYNISSVPSTKTEPEKSKDSSSYSCSGNICTKKAEDQPKCKDSTCTASTNNPLMSSVNQSLGMANINIGQKNDASKNANTTVDSTSAQNHSNTTMYNLDSTDNNFQKDIVNDGLKINSGDTFMVSSGNISSKITYDESGRSHIEYYRTKSDGTLEVVKRGDLTPEEKKYYDNLRKNNKEFDKGMAKSDKEKEKGDELNEQSVSKRNELEQSDESIKIKMDTDISVLKSKFSLISKDINIDQAIKQNMYTLIADIEENFNVIKSENLKHCRNNYVTGLQVCNITQNRWVNAGVMALDAFQVASTQMSTAETCGGISTVANTLKSLVAIGKMSCLTFAGLCTMQCGKTTKKAVTIISKTKELISQATQAINQLNTNNSNGFTMANSANSITSLESIISSATSLTESSQVLSPIGAQRGSECTAKLDPKDFISMATGLGATVTSAKMCKDQLSNSQNNLSNVSNQQMNVCSDPSSLQCKCYQNPNGEGCPGASPNGGFVKSLTPGGGNQMASISSGGIQKPNLDLGKTTLGGSGDSSSSGSTATLGGNNNSGIDSKATGLQAAVAGSAGGGGLGSPSGEKNQKVDPTVEASNMGSNYKFGGSGYNRGSSFGGKGQLSGQKYSDMQKKLERQIATQKYRSEVSEAGGSSNWNKIKNRYTEIKSTFVGQ